MDSRDYWLERETQNALKSDRYVDNQINLITRWFGRAKKEMSAKILEFYRKYAEKEGLTIAQAKQQLNDPKLLKTTLEEYYALVEMSSDDAGIQALLYKLNVKRSISREEFLKLQLDLIIDRLYNSYEEITTNTLTSCFEDSYYKDLFDFQQFQGFGNSFNRLSTNQIIAAITTNWSGKNYSERIWDQKASLARRVNRIITTGMITGRSNKEMRQELEKEVDTSTYNARRLIRTESCYVTGQAAMLSYKQNGTEKYRYYAVLDFKTSEICRELDGNVYDVDKAEVGLNYPPMHPHCRSRTAPYVPDEELDEISGVGTRAARDHEGNSYSVPNNMNYKEWYKKYIEDVPEAELYEKKVKNIYADNIQYKKYKNILGRDAPKSLDDMQTLKYTDSDNWEDLKSFVRYKNKQPNASRTDYSIYKDVSALGIKGNIIVPPENLEDISSYAFDDEHINLQRSHKITRNQAEKYIKNSKVMIKKWNDEFYNYYSIDGAAFVNVKDKLIRTAFSSDEFDDPANKIREVLKKYE